MPKKEVPYTVEELNKMLPSKLLTLAVDDLVALKKIGVKEDMSRWVVNKGKVCTVCLAGACMVGSNGFKLPENPGGELFGDYEYADVLNDIRKGQDEYSVLHQVKRAKSLNRFRDVSEDDENAVSKAMDLIQDNYNDRLARAPIAIYRKAAKMLAAAGL